MTLSVNEQHYNKTVEAVDEAIETLQKLKRQYENTKDYDLTISLTAALYDEKEDGIQLVNGCSITAGPALPNIMCVAQHLTGVYDTMKLAILLDHIMDENPEAFMHAMALNMSQSSTWTKTKKGNQTCQRISTNFQQKYKLTAQP